MLDGADLARRLADLSPQRRAAFELRLRAAESAGTLLDALPIVAAAARQGEGTTEVPLSFAQQRFWYLAQLDPRSPAYNVPIHLRLRGRLDVRALARALDTIVARHAILRTTFAISGDQPLQVVHAPGSQEAGQEAVQSGLRIVDLRALGDRHRRQEAARHAADSALAPFDLEVGPLLRRSLLRLRDDEHTLLLCVHHVLSDGWSMGVLGGELRALYAAFRHGEPSPLPPLAIQYTDYARWERERLRGEALAAEVAWWQRQLAEAPRLLALPSDRPRPPARSQRGGVVRFAVDGALAARIEELGRSGGATAFITLLAAYAGLLARATGQERVVVGSPVANRRRRELEPLIGCFVNTLPLCIDTAGGPSFRELVERTRQVVMSAFAHAELPLELLVEALGIRRESDRTPVFQAAFTFENAFAADLELPGLEVTALTAETRSARFDVGLELWPGRDGFGGALEYSSDLFDATTMHRLARQYVRLLASAGAAPDRLLFHLDLLDAGERHQLVREWNDAPPPAGSPDVDFVHRRFAAQAAQRPEAMAVVGNLGRLTYGELAARASALARHLRGLGIGAEALVGLCCQRSPGMLVGLLGILEAGGAYVPLDPVYPRDWLELVRADSEVCVVVTDAASAPLLAGAGARVVLDGEGRLVAAPAAAAPPPAAALDPDHLAYLLYTSGSTGRPKGVAVRHGSLAHVIACAAEQLAVGRSGRVLQAASLSFDASALEIFTALTRGAAVCLVTREELLDGARLGRLLREEGITTMMAVPSILRLIPEGDYPAVTGVMAGGEACPPDVAQRWAPGRRFFNVYAPTENTIYSTAAPWSPPGDGGPAAPPVGRPIAGATVHVVDRELQPLPIGGLGEIHLGGIGLARGYHRHPRLTAERFVPDPFAAEPGARLYRTGDLGRRLADGRLDFVGRADHQVKIRGHRVEMGEIEAALGAHQDVARCAVAPWRDGATELRLAAYFEAAASGAPSGVPSSHELRRFLAARLPAYMLPAVFVRMAALPLLASGKVDRRALPAPSVEGPDARGAEPPRNAVESTLAAIWQEVLGRERVGIRDNFFDLGGDSILSIQIVSRARRAGLELTARQVFERQTIAELAEVAAPLSAASTRTVPAVGGEPLAAPLTPVQAWFLEQELAEPAHFNLPLLLAVDPAFDDRIVARAVEALVARHDALRLVVERSAERNVERDFGRDAVSWRQRALPPELAPRLAAVDLSGLPAAARHAAMSAAGADLQTSLRLAGPLLRAACFDLGGEDRRLLFVAHHLTVDAVSWTILLADLEVACRQLERGAPVDFGPPSLSFTAWAAGVAAAVGAGGGEDEIPYWRGLRLGTPPPLPRDHPAGAADLGSTRIVSAELGLEATRLLQEAGHAYGTEPLELLLAAVAAAFGRWTGGDSLLLDVEGHGREEALPGADLSRTVGWFTSLFPLLLRATADDDPGARLKAIKEQVRRLPRKGVGYGLLRYFSVRPEVRAELAALPRPEVAFNFLGRVGAAAEGPPGAIGSPIAANAAFANEATEDAGNDLTANTAGAAFAAGAVFTVAAEPIGRAESPRNACLHLLELQAGIAGGRLRLDLRYSARVHTPAMAESLVHGVLAEVRTLVEHCTAPGVAGYTPSDFPLAALDQAALDRIAAGFAGAGRAIERLYPLSPMQEGMLFHSLYEGGGEEPYLEQMSCELRGRIDLAAFEEAWRRVIARHDALRTSFLWEGLDRPLQCVQRRVSFSLALHDWSDLDGDAAEQAALAALVEAERRGGVDLASAPLFRMAWVHRSPERGFFVWSHHHAVLDGWSLPVLIDEVLAIYGSLVRGDTEPPRLGPAGHYQDFVSWLERQDATASEAFWRDYLDGCASSGPTPLPHDEGAGGRGGAASPPRTAEVHRRLDAATAAALQELATRQRLTLGTLVQGAWALLLHRHCGRGDVVFGTTSAGRPAELPGADRIVGLFINSLPLRVRIERRHPLPAWLADLQRDQLRCRQHEATPLRRVQAWSGLPREVPLFESLVVVENQPLDGPGLRSDPPIDASDASDAGLEIRNVTSHIRNSLPLTLTAFPHGGLGFRLLHDPGRLPAELGGELLAEVEDLLTAVARDPGGTIGDVLAAAAGEGERRLHRRLDEGRAAQRERLARQRSARLGGRQPAIETEAGE
jgi:amino acid adenylation domain-containing protein/non-ribosomal peptide synthase protein (TIGR01720 family)